MATSEDIFKLAELLRKEGDKILTSKSKFTLSTDLLNKLNDLFDTLLENNESSLTSSFHVLNNPSPINDSIRDLVFLYDFLQRSKSLKLTLDNSNNTIGGSVNISKFRELHFLELHRINVKDLVGLSNLRVKLRCLVCERGFDKLEDIFEKCGGDEYEGGNWIELREAVLNHNGIKIIDNSLKFVPNLTTLDLSHNAIVDCDELSLLPNLKHLNLSFNKLQKVPLFSRQICTRLQVLVLRNNFIEDLQSLSKLVNLTQLDLMENCLIEHNSLIPLSFLAALQWLNLTGNPLSYHPLHRINTVKYLNANTSSVRFILDEDVLSSNERQQVGSLHPKCLHQEIDQSEQSESLERSIRVRPAVINESTHKEEETPKNQSEPMVCKILESVPKDYIKSLYGKTGVTPVDFSSEAMVSSSTPLQEYISDEMAKMQKTDETSHYVTASEIPEASPEESGIYDEPEEEEQLSDDDFESGDSNIFLVNIKDGQKDVFAILGKNHLVERNAITSKVLSKFSIGSIISCTKTVENDVEYIYLEFESLRNNNYRFYLIENSEEKERFYNRVKEIVDARPTEEVLKVFTCLKCSTQFGVEEQNTVHKDKIECPSCNSNLVFEENNS